ncbi:MAG: L-threonylcarbamoyladenylate synthase [Propionibacteriaceae bacterium]|nr:L-threonylcarbamoyladenylate synthase [Propionibacteriaceae bacterium]
MATPALVPWSADDPEAWSRARDILSGGECVVFPTDTVYGIAARADNASAIARLQGAKGRSDSFPPPVLVSDASAAWALARSVTDEARRLGDAWWPGPLTLVLATDRTDLALSASVGTVGVRVPDLAVLRDFLRTTGPVAVSSANKHNRPAAMTVDEAVAQLGTDVALYIDGGPTPGPAPSTVVDCSSQQVTILRVGLVSEQQIFATAGVVHA